MKPTVFGRDEFRRRRGHFRRIARHREVRLELEGEGNIAPSLLPQLVRVLLTARDRAVPVDNIGRECPVERILIRKRAGEARVRYRAFVR